LDGTFAVAIASLGGSAARTKPLNRIPLEQGGAGDTEETEMCSSFARTYAYISHVYLHTTCLPVEAAIKSSNVLALSAFFCHSSTLLSFVLKVLAL
jgi:hypothetical protein